MRTEPHWDHRRPLDRGFIDGRYQGYRGAGGVDPEHTPARVSHDHVVVEGAFTVEGDPCMRGRSRRKGRKQADLSAVGGDLVDLPALGDVNEVRLAGPRTQAGIDVDVLLDASGSTWKRRREGTYRPGVGDREDRRITRVCHSVLCVQQPLGIDSDADRRIHRNKG